MYSLLLHSTFVCCYECVVFFQELIKKGTSLKK